MRPSPQRGNILFLILLAVVLFAALSYAVTSSTNGGGKNAGDEKAQSTVAEMMNYFASMDAAIQRMMLTGDVKDYELNFFYQTAHKYVVGGNDNTNCTESRCRVFDPAGGAVAGRSFPITKGTGASVNGRIFYLSVPGVGTSKPDIVYIVYAVASPVCLEINKRIGINDFIYSVATSESSSTLMYWNAIPVGPIPDTTSTATGLPPSIGSMGTFCACSDATQTACEANGFRPAVYHVLLAR